MDLPLSELNDPIKETPLVQIIGCVHDDDNDQSHEDDRGSVPADD